MPLPREVQLIIEDISNQKEHLLEWEVFGNASEDMRVVLTWRHGSGSMRSLPPTNSIKQWKLRQTSFSTDDAGDSARNSPMDFENDLNKNENERKDSSDKTASVDESKKSKSDNDVESSVKGSKNKSDTDVQSSVEGSKNKSDTDVQSSVEGSKNKSDTDVQSSVEGKKNKSDTDVQSSVEGKKNKSDTDVQSSVEGSKNKSDTDVKSSVEGKKSKSGSDIENQSKKSDESKDVNKSKENKVEEKQDKTETDKNKADSKKPTSNDDSNDSNRDSPKDMKPKKKNPFRKVKKDEKATKKGKLNLNLSVDNAEDNSSSTKNENLLNEKIDEHPNENDAGSTNNETTESKTKDSASNEKTAQNYSDKNKGGKDIAQLGDDESKKSRKHDDSEQFYKKHQTDKTGCNDVETDESNKSGEKKKIIELEEDEGVKRKRRPGYDDNQEWSQRKNDDEVSENSADSTSSSNAQDSNVKDSNAKNSNAKDSNAKNSNEEIKRKQREQEEQEWKRRNQEKNAEKSDEKTEELSKEEQEKLRKELIEKTRKEVEELEKIGEKEETSEMKEAKSEEGAQKLLQMQRQKFQMSIDEEALELVKTSEEKKNLVNGSMASGDGSEMNGDLHSKDLSNGVIDVDDSTIHAWNSQDEHITAKDKRKVLKKSKDVGDDMEYNKKGRSNIRMVTHDLPPLSEVRPVSEMLGKTGWENCEDCRYNGFCDNFACKREYALILLSDSKYNQFDSLDCDCNVCSGGAVHNGCVYRELLRLKYDYKLFDKRNFCVCRICVPFKYRRLCLRQELRIMKEKGKDLYYRLTYDGDDGKEGYHPQGFDSDDSNYHTDDDEDAYSRYPSALCLDDIDIEITKEDKIFFRNCIDCQFNGFCDNIRCKKLYLMLLRIDDEDFEDLEDECLCLVCEYRGAAHNGCALREIRRLKYDFLLFDKRNLCDCKQCIPFKYRTLCLRQEMKLLRRLNGINLYNKL